MSHADWMIEKETGGLDGPDVVAAAELSRHDLVMREYEFIVFDLDHFTPRPVWICKNGRHGHELGKVQWYQAWRRYCLFTVPMVLSESCANDIADFLKRVRKWEAAR